MCKPATCHGEDKARERRVSRRRAEQRKGNWCGALRGDFGYLGPVPLLSGEASVPSSQTSKQNQNKVFGTLSYGLRMGTWSIKVRHGHPHLKANFTIQKGTGRPRSLDPGMKHMGPSAQPYPCGWRATQTPSSLLLPLM